MERHVGLLVWIPFIRVFFIGIITLVDQCKKALSTLYNVKKFGQCGL